MGGVEDRRYAYDPLDRLLGERVLDETGGVQRAAAWQYDMAGNRTNQVADGEESVYGYTEANRLTGWTGGAAAFDAAGNMTNAAYQDGGILRMKWNGRYELVAVAGADGAGLERYGYDAYGRRAWVAQDAVTNWYVYDGPHVVAEVDAAGALKKSYTYGPGIDNVLSMTVYDGATNTYYYLKDHLGSVLAMADGSGAVVESYRYDAWGRVLGVYNGSGMLLAESALGNRYLWQGREYSWKTGLYYFRARWYDPITGRWLSNDPIGISGGLNQYVFCGNNPVNFVDPFGLFQTGMFVRGLAGAVVSGAGAVVGAAAATTGVGTLPGGALALYSSYNFGANVGNIINSFRDVQAAPTGPIAGATVLATDSRTARNIAEAVDLAIPFALSVGTSPVAWSRLPSVPVGPAGTLAGTLQRVPGDPALIYPWIRGFQLGDAGLTAYDAWSGSWGGAANNNNPCK